MAIQWDHEYVSLLRLITCQAAPFGRGSSQAEIAFLALRSSTFCKATITSNMGLCWHSLGLTMPENTCSSRRAYAECWQLCCQHRCTNACQRSCQRNEGPLRAEVNRSQRPAKQPLSNGNIETC